MSVMKRTQITMLARTWGKGSPGTLLMGMSVGAPSVEKKMQVPKNWKLKAGTLLVVQWLRLWTPNAGGLGPVAGQGTITHTPQLEIPLLQLRSGADKWTKSRMITWPRNSTPECVCIYTLYLLKMIWLWMKWTHNWLSKHGPFRRKRALLIITPGRL